jgi:hypothetical protein
MEALPFPQATPAVDPIDLFVGQIVQKIPTDYSFFWQPLKV